MNTKGDASGDRKLQKWSQEPPELTGFESVVFNACVSGPGRPERGPKLKKKEKNDLVRQGRVFALFYILVKKRKAPAAPSAPQAPKIKNNKNQTNEITINPITTKYKH